MNTTIDRVCRRIDWEGDNESGPPPADPAKSERDERTAAQERYSAYLSSGADRPRGSVVACPVRAPADPICEPAGSGPTVAFLKEAGDTDEVDPRDVTQGPLGDCYLMVSLAGLARSPEGRALLRNAIVENKNDAGQVVSYTVTLHEPERHLFSPTTFREVQVTVDGSFGCWHAVPRADAPAGVKETWPLVIEQAYAQRFGGYQAIGGGGLAVTALEAVTGRGAEHTMPRWLGGFDRAALANQVANGKVVVLGTKDGATKLVGRHAYLVTDTKMEGGKLYVDLHNPWGCDMPHVAFEDIEDSIQWVDVGAP